jgi:DNA-binding CsgD family transcriptional regulator
MHQTIAPELSRLEDIARFCDNEDMDTLIHKLREIYGLGHVTYYSFSKTRNGETVPYVKTTYPSEWIGRYVGRSYLAIDPVVENGFRRVLPFDWASLDRTSEPVRQLFGESIEFGVGKQGLSIPIVGERTKGLVSITSDDVPRVWTTRKTALVKDFQAIAGFMHLKVFSETDRPPASHPLSRRECECLQWAALGKTDEEIADILGLSRLTISTYIKSARYKLGCINRVSAVAKAIGLQIIHP